MSLLFLLLIAMPLLASFVVLWGLLAMASWSDRQIAGAWEEWQAANGGTNASRD